MQFGRVNIYKDNFEVNDPSTSNDIAQGYEPGSRWINTSTFAQWICLDNTAGAAQWFPVTSEQAVATLIGANMNVITDQAFVFPFGAGRKFGVDSIIASNASTSLTTAVGGIYNTAAKGGVAIVANTQVYSALTGAGLKVNLTIAAAGATLVANAPIFLSLTTPQGGAATADLYIFGKYLRS